MQQYRAAQTSDTGHQSDRTINAENEINQKKDKCILGITIVASSNDIKISLTLIANLVFQFVEGRALIVYLYISYGRFIFNEAFLTLCGECWKHSKDHFKTILLHKCSAAIPVLHQFSAGIIGVLSHLYMNPWRTPNNINLVLREERFLNSLITFLMQWVDRAFFHLLKIDFLHTRCLFFQCFNLVYY